MRCSDSAACLVCYTKIEYRAVSGIFRTIGPPPPLHPANVSSPAPRVSDPYPNLSCWIRIRIQIADPDPEGQK